MLRIQRSACRDHVSGENANSLSTLYGKPIFRIASFRTANPARGFSKSQETNAQEPVMRNSYGNLSENAFPLGSGVS